MFFVTYVSLLHMFFVTCTKQTLKYIKENKPLIS